MTVQWLYDWLDNLAPFDSAEDYDNSGLITGRMDQPVTNILMALDCTEQVIEEAAERNANVLITHHPLLFHPRRNLREEDWEGRLLCGLVRNRIALISAHTSLDRAKGGVNDVLARRLGLKGVQGTDYLRLGSLPGTMTAKDLQAFCALTLGAPVRLYGSPDAPVSVLAVGSGAFSGGWKLAKEAQAYLTGEVKHNDAMEAVGSGMVLLEAGHYATEAPVMDELARSLQNAIHKVQWKVNVYQTNHMPYEGAATRS